VRAIKLPGQAPLNAYKDHRARAARFAWCTRPTYVNSHTSYVYDIYMRAVEQQTQGLAAGATMRGVSGAVQLT
jgi:hypothetical protein